MDIQKQLQRGMSLHQQGKLDCAARIYDQILQISPNQPNALHLCALIQQQQGKRESAIEMIHHALRNAPYSGLMHYDLGIIYRETKQYEQAINSFQTAIQLDPQLDIAVEMLGKTLVESSRYEDAVTFYSSLLKQRPQEVNLYSQLAMAQKQSGQLVEAEATMKMSLQICPDNHQAYNELGAILWEQKKLKQAVDAFETAVKLQPKNASAWSNLGAVLHERKRHSKAKTALMQAVELNPTFAGAHFNLANVIRDSGDFEEAVTHYQLAIKCNSDSVDFRINYVTTLNNLGQFEESARQCREIIKRDPQYTPAYYALFTFNAETVTEEEVRKLDELLANSELSDRDKREAYFSLGKYFDKRDQYDKAFSCFETANRLDDRHGKFNPQKLTEMVDGMIETFQKHSHKLNQLEGSSSRKPIFILGMPRSGSTLIDQILTSHPQVNGAGEFAGIRAILEHFLKPIPDSSLEYPHTLAQLTTEQLRKISQEYLRLLEKYAGDADFITDKMPNNAFHLGLINLMFPNATIIYTARNPLDICLSCFFQNFSAFHEFSFDLRTTGKFYREHARLISFWKQLLPGRIQTVEYEKLVVDQEAETHRLVEDICGLAWEEDCLRFHQNKRAVNTASLWQVRQPMYQKSVSKWKKYAKHLEPLLEELGMQDSSAA